MNTSFFSDFPDFGDFIRRHIRNFPMTVELVAAGFAFADPNTPAWAKGIIGAAIAYVLCPLDAIPDWILIVGWTDDLGVLGGVLTGTAAAFITDEHRRKARQLLGLE